MRRHLALTGFMASGKSTAGKKLARKLGCAFYDIDDLIVRDHGAIDAIFYNEGEAQFRKYEHEAIARVLDEAPGVIALGGGAVTHAPSFELLKKRTYRIFVKATPEQVIARLRRSTRVRPLVGPTPTLSKIRDLYTKRMPYYSHADLVVEAHGLTSTQVADTIVDWMHKKRIVL